MNLRESGVEGHASVWASMVNLVAAAASREVPDTCNPRAQKPVSSPASPTQFRQPTDTEPLRNSGVVKASLRGGCAPSNMPPAAH